MSLPSESPDSLESLEFRYLDSDDLDPIVVISGPGLNWVIGDVDLIHDVNLSQVKERREWTLNESLSISWKDEDIKFIVHLSRSRHETSLPKTPQYLRELFSGLMRWKYHVMGRLSDSDEIVEPQISPTSLDSIKTTRSWEPYEGPIYHGIC